MQGGHLCYVGFVWEELGGKSLNLPVVPKQNNLETAINWVPNYREKCRFSLIKSGRRIL